MRLTARSFVSLSVIMLGACTSGEKQQSSSTSDETSHLWPLSTKSEDARKWTDAGEVAFDAGLNDDSHQDFKRAVAADSAFAYGYLRIAQNANSLDEYRANLQRANAFISTANPSEKLLIEAENRFFAGDVQAGLDSLKKLMAMLPDNPRAPWVLAQAQLITAGQTDSARATAKRIMELAPNWGIGHLTYGTFYTSEPMDLAKAEEHILIGQKLWPDKAVSYDLLGDLRRAQGRLEEAAAAYTKQIELSPKEALGHNQRGHAYTFLGKFDSARADYDASIRLGKGNGPAFNSLNRAYVDAYAGHPEEAISRLEQLGQAIDGMGIPEPEGFKIATLQSIAVLASHVGKFDVADSATAQMAPLIRKGIERVNTPEYRRGQEAIIAFWEGRAAAFKGDYALALRKAEEYKKLREPDRDPTKDRSYHVLRGFVALGQKRYADAVTELSQGDPDNPFQRYHRALALEALGKTAEAKVIYKSVAIYNFNEAGYAAIRREAIAKAGT
jgi:tetratricopeptide (TPR) repeat protein